MKAVAVCLALCLCAACSPQRRLNRLVARHPELAAVDTLRLRKIYPLPAKKAVLSFPAERLRREGNDPIAFTLLDTTSNISVAIADNAGGDIFYVSVTTPPDSLVADIAVPVKTVTVAPQSGGFALIENLPLLLLTVAVLALALRRK